MDVARMNKLNFHQICSSVVAVDIVKYIFCNLNGI